MTEIVALKSIAKKTKRVLKRNVEHNLSKVLGGRLYYSANGTFGNEQRAVLAGARMHFIGESSYESRMFLRRSVHRIEKGMVSRPMRDTFAADYIDATVKTFMRLSAAENIDSGELQWARDVLTKYFAATSTSGHPDVVSARHRWAGVVQPDTMSGPELAPFPQPQLAELESTQEAFFALARHRRSVRWYMDLEVPQDLVDEAIRVGLTAPSACNRQSFRVVLVRDEQLKIEVAKVPMGTAGFAHQIPVLAVIVGQHRGYEHPRDRHAIYVDGGLFAAQFVLALEASGLNSCCINWPDLADEEAKLRTLIPLDDDERPVMMIAIGYGETDQLVPRSHKRDLDTVREWM